MDNNGCWVLWVFFSKIWVLWDGWRKKKKKKKKRQFWVVMGINGELVKFLAFPLWAEEINWMNKFNWTKDTNISFQILV
jgi:hypothetical protein